ncbi:MAG: hemolysin III family protein [bacterium]|nr:hemolysin III family protein [bacterium]
MVANAKATERGRKGFKVKDPVSAGTHFAGFILAIIATPIMLVHVVHCTSRGIDVFGYAIFMASMIALYAASTVYHTFDRSEKVNRTLKKIDHCMIFFLIAGTYTPICITILNPKTGLIIGTLVWGVGIAGVIFKLFWVYCPRWVSTAIYVTMGWICVLAFGQMIPGMGMASFGWLLAGGIMYTIGGIIYALKLPLLERRFPNFGAHELFHCFVIAGTVFQCISLFIMI